MACSICIQLEASLHSALDAVYPSIQGHTETGSQSRAQPSKRGPKDQVSAGAAIGRSVERHWVRTMNKRWSALEGTPALTCNELFPEQLYLFDFSRCTQLPVQRRQRQPAP